MSARSTPPAALCLALVAFGATAQASLGWPVRAVAHPAAALAGAAVLAFVAVGCTVARRVPVFFPVATLAFLLDVALWRHADGGALSAYAPLAGIPVVWLGLHGSRRSVWAAVVGVGLVFVTPMLLVGGSEYPATDCRRAALWVLLAGVSGPTISRLVGQREAEHDRVAELQPAGAQLDGLLKAARGHSIIATDLDGLITVFNPGAEGMLGWTAAEMIGKQTPAVIHDPNEVVARAAELDIDPGFEVFVKAAREGEVETRLWTYLTKSGERLTVSLTVTAVHDAAEQLVGFIGIATDVTTQRRALASVQHERAIRQLLIEHLPNTTVGLLDESMRWLTLSGHWMVHNGVSDDAICGRRPSEVFPNGTGAEIEALYRKALDGPVHDEMLTDSKRWYEVDALPIKAPDGSTLVLSVARDITERRESDLARDAALAALATSEENFRTAFEGTPIGIALTSVEATTNGVFLRVNDSFACLLGCTADALVGTAVDDVTHPDDRHIRKAVTDGVARIEKRYVHSSGRTVWVDVFYSTVHDASGQPLYFITHIEDVTTRRQSERALLHALEQQREATEKLRQIDDIRADMVSTVSHEIRTPLTSISGFTEMLLDGDAGELSDSQRTMTETIDRNANSLLALVNDLLTLSRLDASASQNSERRGPIVVVELVQAAMDTIRPAIHQRGQTVEALTTAPDLRVIGDADQLYRVLINLLSNANKYTPDEGAITISVIDAGNDVEIMVSDTGIGIAPADQERLFDRFFRAGTALEHAIGGTGLGLAIAKSIVEQHFGEISVDSRPGGGTRFRILLPKVHEPVLAASAPYKGAPTCRES